MIIVGSLCSGYGGLDLGLELALGPVRHAWHVEYDKHPSAILAHRFPGIPNYGDVKTTDWASLERPDWLTAGYPCQPFSLAGLRKGADDPRHLWPGVADAIRVLRPGHVLLENVAAHLRDGFDTVLADLAAMGYDASWGVVRASDAGAPHGRARLFVVAEDTDGPARGQRGLAAPGQALAGVGGRHGAPTDAAGDRRGEGRTEPARLVGRPDAALSGLPAPTDPNGDGLEGVGGLVALGRDAHRCGGQDIAWGAYEPAVRRWERATGRAAPRPTEPGRTSERLSPRFVEWLMGLPAGWVTDVPGLPRNAQLKALGNGVVPQQAALAVRLLVPAAQLPRIAA